MAGGGLAAATGVRAAADFALVPLVNVRGRAIFESGDYCRRTNDRGVDLNRKQLSEMSIQDPAAFEAVVATAREALA